MLSKTPATCWSKSNSASLHQTQGASSAFPGSGWATPLDVATDAVDGVDTGAPVGDAAPEYTEHVYMDGVNALDIDAAGAEFTLAFADVEVAEIEFAGANASEWTHEIEGSTFRVSAPDSTTTIGCVTGCGESFGNDRVTLTLPEYLEQTDRLEAVISVRAGSFTGSGAVDSLDLDVAAGSGTWRGEVADAEVSVETGTATLALENVRTADVAVATGSANVQMTGEAPDRIDVAAEMGEAVVTLPDAAYQVTEEAELGEIHNRLDTAEDSAHLVNARVQVGSVTLR